jgi:organic hydroperoxide reductase OsmC/OhrA
MASYTATVTWERNGQAFVDQRYSRRHTVQFDGGVVLPGSSSPHVVPVPLSDASAVDPEELFVASLSTCHMLWFLSIAAARGFVVDQYRDAATGQMARNAAGAWTMSVVTLHPAVQWSGATPPTAAEVDAMHHEAHASCFIANSVRTDVRCEPVTA